MKVCIPATENSGIDSPVGQHFGKVPYYAIYDSETGKINVLENTSEHMGGVGLPPELLANEGVETMLCGGLGWKAVQMFDQFGIKVFVGAQGKVSDAIEDWKNERLEQAGANNSCSGHDHEH
ncbi:NifB/NifX family molybdenum-iron cluster-binding protein [Methanohalophilus halophilus]|uniref:Dinitrogenase iron-molybdenum cofactor biosynthesis protein n=1 Tax=Methanohalophilus halophilus TaxID=2177 RepID=A0A1L3Q0N6_9EURY|nr:NifB/NifX family molybdenum-iron cluster-binding protein [Methanohalophilus halophilus]APH38403.1 dinitrogenase iron-molybdenum cofactor biosynthesis protein [Methanohalophilus halophilus]RNI10726.1 dinitrogenase iron-molybdenum cofactor biosynthesis protein [Methanohalophilus halophilus]SDW05976.1 Predicted Fe-Mo cluster-binding protein, NifX family [Methanohalophilus halophilus]